MKKTEIFNKLLCGERINVQLSSDKEAENLHKSLSKRWKKFQTDMQAAHYKALPEGDFTPYNDAGLSSQTVGYECGEGSSVFSFFIREKKANQIAATKNYQIINQPMEQA